MSKLQGPFLIFSAELSELSVSENRRRTSELAVILGDRYVPVQGYYKGQPESSFLVLGADMTADVVPMITERFGQECILEVDEDNEAALYFNDGSIHNVGVFQEVSENEAMKSPVYSIINGRYYIAD